MSKEHFEPVTARTIAEIIVNNAYIGYTAGTNKRAVVDSAEDILAPHIRKPSDDDKSVPARCEEAYNKAIKLIKEAVIIIDGKQGTGKWQEEVYKMFTAKNPFKEAVITDDKPEPRLLPFDLKAAQNGAKVVTHNGRTPVKIVADDISSEYSILATYTGLIGGVYFDQFDLSGRRKGIQDENMNLFILKEPETLEIQIWRDKNDRCYLLTTPNQSGYSKYYEADCELIKTITVTI